MKSYNRLLTPAIATLFVLLIFSVTTNAQSTIFSMPSNDVIKKGNVGVKLIAKFKFNDQAAKKRFTSFTPQVTVGVGKDVEIGLNFLGNTQPGADATTLVPIVKWRAYNNEKHGVSIVVGNHFYIPVRNKKFEFGTYSYAQASKTFSKTKTRLTFGSYLYSKDVTASKANRGGGQFGIEQTINKRFTLAAEWITGKHYNGYFMPGLKVKVNKRAVAIVGYTISNSKASRGNHYFYASVGIKLN